MYGVVVSCLCFGSVFVVHGLCIGCLDCVSVVSRLLLSCVLAASWGRVFAVQLRLSKTLLVTEKLEFGARWANVPIERSARSWRAHVFVSLRNVRGVNGVVSRWT